MQIQNENSISQYTSLFRFFRQNLSRAFVDLDLPASDVLEYLADVLTRFARTSSLYRIKRLENMRLETVVDMLLEAEALREAGEGSSPSAELSLRRHMGDFTLFMSGIFREHVQKMGVLDFYLIEGRLAYRHVFEFARERALPQAQLFQTLSRNFERYSDALDYMKKVYFYYPRIDALIKRTIDQLLSW